MTSSTRCRRDIRSSSARGSRATGVTVETPATMTIAQETAIAARAGAAATSAPEISRCAATIVKDR